LNIPEGTGGGKLAVAWLGSVEYRRAWELQGRVMEAVRTGESPPSLLLLEHPHVFTMGRAGRPENLRWDEPERRRRQVDLVWTDRGGDVTYHGPGQLVGYPILDLPSLGLDILGYLRALERSLIGYLATLEIDSQPGDRDTIGVWIGGDKLAAIGVKVTGGVTSHGFALNLTSDLGYFEGIVPCGLADRGVTSVERQSGRRLVTAKAARGYAAHLAKELGLTPAWVRAEQLLPEPVPTASRPRLAVKL
jgi:lipoate-protein ligase B